MKFKNIAFRQCIPYKHHGSKFYIFFTVGLKKVTILTKIETFTMIRTTLLSSSN